MSKFFLIVLVFTTNIYAQFNDYPLQDEGYLAGGLGLIWIDGQPHYKINLRPEFSFADFGVGFDLDTRLECAKWRRTSTSCCGCDCVSRS